MIRLHITVEGKTEQKFVKDILANHLGNFNIITDARQVLTSSTAQKEYRGGLVRYAVAKHDIAQWMASDNNSECRFTTMFDFYRLPHDFPGYDEAMRLQNPYDKVQKLETALQDDIADSRFLPYIQLHEFEALILADPAKLDWEYLEHEQPIADLVAMMGAQNPELINDGPDTAPSKRILSRIPAYDKVTAGVSVAEHIGLHTMRSKCRHFNDWLTQLEELGGSA